MIGSFQESFRPDDIKVPEVGERMEQREQPSVPTLDDLKSKLEDIFKAEMPDGVSMKEDISETNPLEESNPRSVILDDGTVVTLPDAKTYENVSKTDDNGTVYLKDGELEPNTTYELNGNTYTTDEQGRIIRCEATPERSPENPRDVNAQLQAGGKDRRPSDQGGHIVGRDLNGDGGAGNLVAMDSKINQSDYKRMENDIKAALDEGKDVTVTTDISYSGDSKRPDTIIVTVIADEVKTVYKFDNNLDGGLKEEVPENGKDAVQEELNDTNGEISSIKEEYNENGELTETTVNITYTDENGTNHRTKVYIDAE
mgnify:FL=1